MSTKLTNPPVYRVPMAPIPAEVWTLLIEFDNGSSLTVHRTKAGAEAALGSWVKENWDGPEAMPDDPKEAVAEYFDNHEGEESATIEPAEVED